ncbi:MAG: 16S rRNA (cytidine(1402)-2'-O)-methyltransferase [Bacillota bacterium]
MDQDHDSKKGNLFLCATPIGNLEDITLRVLRVLKEVPLIAAEDTRHTRKLLNHFEISTPLTSYHHHNRLGKGQELIAFMESGGDLALVSDAGMPGISDPGYELVRDALEAGIGVIPLPGPSAAVTALVVSGLPTERYIFDGFFPRQTKEQRLAMERLGMEKRTCVFYEAPHRLLGTLEQLTELFPDRMMAVAREVTKKFEEVIRGTTSEVLQHFRQHPPRGEITLVISGVIGQSLNMTVLEPSELAAEVERLVQKGLDKKAAIKSVAVGQGVPKRDVYRAVLDLNG